MEKLTIKELAPYLPYNLKTNKGWLVGLDAKSVTTKEIGIECFYPYEEIKPILRNLSDLTKEIEHDGEKFVPIKRMLEENNFNLGEMDTEWINSFAKSMIEVEMSYDDAQMILNWKFDIFGLLDKNLAVPVTENFNPYK